MFILHYAPDNASLIIRIALEEMGLPYTTQLVDRRQNSQKSAPYLALNPMGLIPALETPDGVIFETGAILLWLSEYVDDMAPKAGSTERGMFLSWLFCASNGLHSDLRHIFYADKYAQCPDEHRKMAHQRVSEILDKFETLAQQGHAWFCATQNKKPSVLEIYVSVMSRWLALYPKGQTDWFALSNWPHLYDIARNLEQRPSTHVAMKAEGLGPTPFTQPSHPNPPEGVAL